MTCIASISKCDEMQVYSLTVVNFLDSDAVTRTEMTLKYKLPVLISF